MGSRLNNVTDGINSFLHQVVENSAAQTKIKTTVIYVHLIETLREICLLILAISVFSVIGGIGVFLLHVALIMWVPGGWAAKALAGGILGVIDILVVFLVLRFLFSEKRWMHMFKADEAVRKVT